MWVHDHSAVDETGQFYEVEEIVDHEEVLSVRRDEHDVLLVLESRIDGHRRDALDLRSLRGTECAWSPGRSPTSCS